MVSLLHNGRCFRKVAPNTRSSEKPGITGLDHGSGCIAGAAPGGRKDPLLYSSPPEWRPRGCLPSLPSGAPPTGRRLPSARESHAPSVRRPRYLRNRAGGTYVRASACFPRRSGHLSPAGTRVVAGDTRAWLRCNSQSPHLVVGWLQQPTSCGPPGLRSLDHRLCLGLLRGAPGARRGY